MHIENDTKKTFSLIHMHSCIHAFMHIENDTKKRHLAVYTCIHAHRKSYKKDI